MDKHWLTQQEVDNLSRGTEVYVNWSGGNESYGIVKGVVPYLEKHGVYIGHLAYVSPTDPNLTNVHCVSPEHPEPLTMRAIGTPHSPTPPPQSPTQ